MPVPATTSASLRGELLGLQVNILAATTGVMSKTTGLAIRTPNVRNRTYTGLYTGPWPLIQIRWEGYRVEYIAGGQPMTVGQNLPKPNIYSLEFLDVVLPDSAPASEVVATAEDDLIDLFDATVAWFDHMPNRCLPVVINSVTTPMAKIAGLPIMAHGMPPFLEEGDGLIRVGLAAAVGVQGIPRTGSLT